MVTDRGYNMKAYILVDNSNREDTLTVVYSDSDTLAKSYFIKKMESVYGKAPKSYGIMRYPKLDVFYKGKIELDTGSIEVRNRIDEVRRRLCRNKK